MINFEPSEDFVSRTMSAIGRYELQAGPAEKGSFLVSRPVLSLLSAGGVLLGIFNVIRMAMNLLSPSLCF
jgi:hypothetical protein